MLKIKPPNTRTSTNTIKNNKPIKTKKNSNNPPNTTNKSISLTQIQQTVNNIKLKIININ